MKRFHKSTKAVYFRNFVFGVEDSLVSTVGLLSGIASGGLTSKSIVLTGIVLIFVEALSMAVGSFLSEQSTEDYEHPKKPNTVTAASAALIMFFSYFIAGFAPLLPYIIFPVNIAFWTSICTSLLSLAILGIISAHISKTKASREIWEMVILGGAAISIGTIVGEVIKNFAI